MQENQKTYYGIAAVAFVLVSAILISKRMKTSEQKEESKVRFGTVDNYRKKMIQKKENLLLNQLSVFIK